LRFELRGSDVEVISSKTKSRVEVKSFFFEPKATGILFLEHLKLNHPDWHINVRTDDKLYNNKMRIAWLLTRHKLAAHYKLQDNTPQKWFEEIRNEKKCLLCLESLGENTNYFSDLHCDIGKVHNDCLTQHLGQNKTKNCPICNLRMKPDWLKTTGKWLMDSCSWLLGNE